jgi:60 kDa SS-A/Ro ribonucleoprotein
LPYQVDWDHSIDYIRRIDMGTNIYKGKRKTLTPATQPIPGKEEKMVPNQGGGFSFSNNHALLERYLILGITGPTYYATEQKVSSDAEKIIEKYLAYPKDAFMLIDMAVHVSDGGLGMSNDPCLSVLAMASCSKNPHIVKYAMNAMDKIVRTGTDLLHIASFIDSRRSFGRAIRTGFANWIYSRGDKLGFQMAKYQQRDGWSWKDVLRVAHIKPITPEQQALFGWAVEKAYDPKYLPPSVIGMMKLREEGLSNSEVETIVRDYRLPLEMIPTNLRTPGMWLTVLPNLGITAIIRNLGAMSKNGIDKPVRELVIDSLSDENRIQKGRVHPFKVYMALLTYSLGHGVRGKLTWTVDRDVRYHLEQAMYMSFKYGSPTGKKILWGMDISSSMLGASTGIFSELATSPMDCQGVMALAVLESGDDIEFQGFANYLRPIEIRRGSTIEQATTKIRGDWRFGSTDPSLLYQYALRNHAKPYDVVIMSTDNEINTGYHPSELLDKYRERSGIPTKQIVLGMTTNSFSIADPDDPNSLDIAGMSSDVPLVISNFVSGSSSAKSEEPEEE